MREFSCFLFKKPFTTSPKPKKKCKKPPQRPNAAHLMIKNRAKGQVPPRRASGFTLVEFSFVIIILTLLAVLAIPYFDTLQRRLEAKRVPSSLMSLLAQARQYALTQRQRVVVCGSFSGMICDTRWNDGVLIFHDLNRNSKRDADETILGYEAIAVRYGQVTWKGAGARSMIIFQANNGMPNGSNGSLYYCTRDIFLNRQIILSRVGQINLRDLNQDGVYEGAQGLPVACI